MQALEALKLLLGLQGLGANEMLIFDLVTLHTQRLRASRAPRCAAHEAAGKGTQAAPAVDSLELDFAALADAVDRGFMLVDVRDTRERDAEPIPATSIHLPMSRLLTDASSLELERAYLLVCATGKRSTAAADLLRSQGFRHCRSLRGGLKALKVSA
jgi:rhodanese-related sulfurtransferase